MSQLMDVENVDNVLTMPFLKKKEEENQPKYESFEAVKEALESFDFNREMKEISREEEGPVIDLTLDLPARQVEETREMSTVEVYLNMGQNLKTLHELVGKIKYYVDELESIEKTARF